MARKLSTTARCASMLAFVAVASLAANTSLAQEATPRTDPANVIENPFVSSQAQQQPKLKPKQQPKPHVVTNEPQTARRPSIKYQNPFAATSKLPPVDTSLRPGPISRWRHPVIPTDETSAIKSAVLSPPADPAREPWDQLPPAENMRHLAISGGSKSDTTYFPRLDNPAIDIAFTPKPLTQPAWLTPESNETILRDLNPLNIDPAVFNSPFNTGNLAKQTAALSPGPSFDPLDYVSSAVALDPLDVPLSTADVLPTIISDSVVSPESSLAQAQRAATNASSPEDFAAVIELCECGVRGGPDEKLSSSLRRLGAWAHNRRGELHVEAGRADDALVDFQTAIALDSNCSLAIHNRAVTLAQQNQFAAALRDFNRVIELNPGLAIAYRNRAELLAALGRMDEAVADYNQAIETLPSDAQLYRGRAFAYQRLGNLQNSLADLNRAIEIAPDDPDSLTQRGNVSAEQGRYERAITDYRQALTKDPAWAEAHRSLAWLAATCPDREFQNPKQAVAGAEQAVKLAPANDYLMLDTLAAAYASVGQFEKAVDSQRKALANAPPEAAPSLEQRLALYQQGRAFRSANSQTDESSSDSSNQLR